MRIPDNPDEVRVAINIPKLLTPEQIVRARQILGLTQSGLAIECRLRDPHGTGARMIRHYESGHRPVTGPVSRVLELLLEQKGITRHNLI